MTLKEAIEKSGPEGEGYLNTWRFADGHLTGQGKMGKWSFVKIGGGCQFYFCGEPVCRVPSAVYTSSGWEIIEPEQIEVGDTVECNCSGDSREAVIIGKSKKEICIQYEDGGMIILYLHQVDLIRKGPKKHVFERVCGKFYVPVGGNRFEQFVGKDGKTYRMTLEEREEK